MYLVANVALVMEWVKFRRRGRPLCSRATRAWPPTRCLPAAERGHRARQAPGSLPPHPRYRRGAARPARDRLRKCLPPVICSPLR
jgi:hypothetical protein